MIVIEVGKPFPGKLEEGMTTLMEIAPEPDGGLDLTIVANLRNIHPMEFKALMEEPIGLGIVRFDPIIFFLLLAKGPTVFDLPFGIGLYAGDKPTRLAEVARHARNWPSKTRRTFDLLLVEPETNLVTCIRRASLTRAWWVTLADELDRCPLALARKEYKAAIQAAYGRWKEPLAMVPDCIVLEKTA